MNEATNAPGWPDGFADLYRSARQPMVRVAYLVTRSPARAEELVQDAFVEVLQRWQGIDNPAAYLRTSVVRAAVRSKRRRQREDEFAARQLPDVVVDPAIDEMRAALADLPAKQRAALVLRFYEDCSHEQIAATLGCSPGAARLLTHRALNSLRKDLTRWTDS